MAWSYSGDPLSSSKDAVRFLLGDTDSTDTLTLSDNEILFLLTEWDGNTYFAAAAGAEQLAGQFAREVAFSSDDVSFGGDDLQQKYITLAVQLRAMGRRRGKAALPYDGSNDCADWQENVEKLRLGITDNRRDGANAPTGFYLNPLLDQDTSGYASDA